jgi:predicted nucleotidyltransferase
VPLKLTLPSNLEARIGGLGEAIAASCPGVLFMYLFGSAAGGARTPRSDVDLAVFVEHGADAHATQLAVARVAARQLGTDAIDVVLLNRAPISVAGRVLGTRQVLLDRDPYARHRYESATARLFQDFRIHERRVLAERAAHG